MLQPIRIEKTVLSRFWLVKICDPSTKIPHSRRAVESQRNFLLENQISIKTAKIGDANGITAFREKMNV